MPEGDTIHRAAAALRIALVGKPIVSFDAPRLVGPRPAPGRVIERVESHGKHMEIVWDDGLTLHTHMRMMGSWHLYRVGEAWRRPASQLRVLIEVGDWLAVCFNAPVVETYRHFDRHRHPGFGPLGPDLCKADSDLDECINRLYHYQDQTMPIGEAMLDQHVVCGVGNVYRCESLWACETYPFAAVAQVEADLCAQLVTTAARLLRANLTVSQDPSLGTRRNFASGVGDSGFGPQGLGVYGRNGQRCRRCGDTIEVRRSGEHARLLYWCPGCQVRGRPELDITAPVVEEERPMDPHPAARKYIDGLPWRRDRLTG